MKKIYAWIVIIIMIIALVGVYLMNPSAITNLTNRTQGISLFPKPTTPTVTMHDKVEAQMERIRAEQDAKYTTNINQNNSKILNQYQIQARCNYMDDKNITTYRDECYKCKVIKDNCSCVRLIC